MAKKATRRAAPRRRATAVGETVLTIDRMLNHTSTAPMSMGKPVRLFLRERVLKSIDDRPDPRRLKGKAILMVHGGFWPSTVPFDLQYQDYSWMEFLARAGYDVFALDMTGYGRSSRPRMDDPRNLPPEDQDGLIPDVLPSRAEPSWPFVAATTNSDCDDIDCAVEWIRAFRGVDKVSLIGWSGGGVRTGTYTVRHPGKVDKLVIFATSNYDRDGRDDPPPLPQRGHPLRFQTRAVGETKRWDSCIRCPDQVSPGIKDMVWNLSLDSDPVGASWGPGGLRAPTRTIYGWNTKAAQQIDHPTLIMIGEFDRLMGRNIDFYSDLGAKKKVFVEIACGSHFMPWEKNRGVLHRGSLEWISKGTFQGKSTGTFRAEAVGKVKKKPIVAS